jgi:hypothetical protein
MIRFDIDDRGSVFRIDVRRMDDAFLKGDRRPFALLDRDEAEAELKRDPFFTERGVFNEPKFLAVKSTQPETFRSAIEAIFSPCSAANLRSSGETSTRPLASSSSSSAKPTSNRFHTLACGSKLEKAMRLRPDQKVILSQPVGYPKD